MNLKEAARAVVNLGRELRIERVINPQFSMEDDAGKPLNETVDNAGYACRCCLMGMVRLAFLYGAIDDGARFELCGRLKSSLPLEDSIFTLTTLPDAEAMFRFILRAVK